MLRRSICNTFATHAGLGILRAMDHASQIIAVTRDPSAAARSAISASWVRSLTLHGLDPACPAPRHRLSQTEFSAARTPSEALLASAAPTLDRLFSAVGDTGSCVLIAAADGLLLDRRGMAGDDGVFESWGLWPGTFWSEESEGTNGIGTCLADESCVIIHREEHFHTRNIILSCTTAPIYDHCGRLAGAIDVSTCRADLTRGYAGLIASAVADAARRIEARHFRAAFPGARIVVVPETDWSAGALLALSRDDLVIGATRAARLACNITDVRLAAPLHADTLLDRAAEEGADLAHAERLVLARALSRASGNVSAAARALGVSRATMHRKMRQLGVARGG